jgi:hypothetical protein
LVLFWHRNHCARYLRTILLLFRHAKASGVVKLNAMFNLDDFSCNSVNCF